MAFAFARASGVIDGEFEEAESGGQFTIASNGRSYLVLATMGNVLVDCPSIASHNFPDGRFREADRATTDNEQIALLARP